MKKVILGCLIVVSCSGCWPYQDGVMIVGTPEGIRAYADGQNGLITNGKASDDIKSAHWAAREEQEKQETQRALAPGWLAELFVGPAKK
jgi:hypothetical protein